MISGLLHTALTGLVSGRIYPNTFPQEVTAPTWPAIRYRISGGESFPDVCGSDDGDTDDVDVQIDVVAKTYGAMVTLRDQVMTALLNLDPPAVRTSYPVELYDAETKTHRAILLYTFTPSQ